MPTINSNVKILIKFNESDAAFTDSIGNAVSNGGVAYTAAGKYGGAGVFDGGSNHYLIVADSESFDLGTGDFTIGWWHKGSVAMYNTIIGRKGTGVLVHLYNNGMLLLGGPGYAYQSGADVDIATLTDGNLHYLEVCRISGTVYMSIGGRQLPVSGSSNSTNYNFDGAPCIGSQDNTNRYVGIVDEFVLVVGEGLHSVDFTPSEWVAAAAGVKAPHYYQHLMAGGIGRC